MKILFLCTGNSCRSQMAEGYARHFGLEVKSAGLSPKGVNPLAISVMKEDGIDISSHQSTLLTKDLLEWGDLLITLCGDANESCPVLPKGKEKRHWPFEDPAKATGTEEEILKKFRSIRDGIKTEILKLVSEYKIEKTESVPNKNANNRINDKKEVIRASENYSLNFGNLRTLCDKPIVKYGLAATATVGLFFMGYKLLKGDFVEMSHRLLPKSKM